MEHETVKEIWNAYLNTLGENSRAGLEYEAWHFCDNKTDADYCAQIVLDGEKRATTSVLRAYERDSEELPKIGELSVITDFEGVAKCVIKTTDITICAFQDVPESYAAREGEGDKSLAHWKRVHKAAFSREMQALGEAFTEDMNVVCESFEVVYPMGERM